jgi:hypothetical protein
LQSSIKRSIAIFASLSLLLWTGLSLAQTTVLKKMTLLKGTTAMFAKAAGIAYVNGTGASNGSSGVSSLSAPGLNVTGGNSLIVSAFQYSNTTAPIPSSTDGGDTFTLIGSDTTTATDMWVWLVSNAVADSSKVIKLSPNGGTLSFPAFTVDQYSGLSSTLDGSAHVGYLTTTGAVSTPSFNTSNANDLIFAVASQESTAAVWTANSPLTLRNTSGSWISSADDIVTSTQTGFVATMTNSSGSGEEVIIGIAIKAL